jgi:hypothetical protein
MKFMTHTEQYSLLDQRRNESNLGLEMDQIKKKLAQYKENCLHERETDKKKH